MQAPSLCRAARQCLGAHARRQRLQYGSKSRVTSQPDKRARACTCVHPCALKVEHARMGAHTGASGSVPVACLADGVQGDPLREEGSGRALQRGAIGRPSCCGCGTRPAWPSSRVLHSPKRVQKTCPTEARKKAAYAAQPGHAVVSSGAPCPSACPAAPTCIFRSSSFFSARASFRSPSSSSSASSSLSSSRICAGMSGRACDMCTNRRCSWHTDPLVFFMAQYTTC